MNVFEDFYDSILLSLRLATEIPTRGIVNYEWYNTKMTELFKALPNCFILKSL